MFYQKGPLSCSPAGVYPKGILPLSLGPKLPFPSCTDHADIIAALEARPNLPHCFAEEGLLYRARYFGDTDMYNKAQKMGTPSCNRLSEVQASLHG